MNCPPPLLLSVRLPFTIRLDSKSTVIVDPLLIVNVPTIRLDLESTVIVELSHEADPPKVVVLFFEIINLPLFVMAVRV